MSQTMVRSGTIFAVAGSMLAGCAHGGTVARPPATQLATSTATPAVVEASLPKPDAQNAALKAAETPNQPPSSGPAAQAGSADAMQAPAAPPDPHKWDFCEVRRPKQAAAGVRYINPETLFEASTYSFAAAVPTSGKVVHFSGQIPVDMSYAVQGTTLVEQLHVAIRNLCLAMQGAGVTTADVFKLGINYVHKDAADPFVLAEEMQEFFDRSEMPATTMTAAPYIVTENIRVQVEASAYLPESRGKR